MPYDPTFKQNFIEGVSRFQNARMQAFWEESLALLRGKPSELLSFDDIRERLRLGDESYRGVQDIPIDKIVGSVGRYRDFTSNFLPRRGKMQERWSRVYAKATSMEGLPPIEVFKVGDAYFVRDGNHRVSVARQMKNKTIEAYVTELRSPIYLHAKITQEELDDATIYTRFLAETRLNITRPHLQSLQLSEPSRYGEMLQMIYLHHHTLEQFYGREVRLEDAAAHWYDRAYRPAVTLIRKYDVLSHVPARKEGKPRTEADLFMWLVDHLRDVRHELGDEESYGEALVSFLAENKMDVPDALYGEDDEAAPVTRTQLMRTLTPSGDAPSSGNNVHNRQPA
jgi:hypothetical protein